MGKKRMILEVALTFFRDNGIQQVSIEEIARECKMSKTTFYKFFSSKEQLVYEVIIAIGEKLGDEIRLINQGGLQGKEKLRAKLVVIWNQIFTQTIYNVYITEKLEERKLEDLIKRQRDIRTLIVEEYKKGVLEYYGKTSKENIWDLIFCIDSVMHQFVFIARTKKIHIDAEFVAEYGLAVLELVDQYSERLPAIDQGLLSYDTGSSQEESLEEQLEQGMVELQKVIEEQLAGNQQVKEAAMLMQEKIQSKEYESIIIDGMSALLEKNDSLRPLIKKIMDLRGRMVKENYNGI